MTLPAAAMPTAIPPPMGGLHARPCRFSPDDFVPSRLADVATKARFASQFTRFLSANCSAQQFPTWFYRILVQTFGLPRHASRADLLSRWFASDSSRAEFVQRILAYVPAAQPARGFADVELRLQHWLTASGAATEIVHRSTQLNEAAERHLLRVLLDRYPDELERQATPSDVLPLQPDLFPEDR